MNFKPGDVVQLKSGGPKMTVSHVDEFGASCVWFDKDARKQEYFEPAVLKSVAD